MPIFLSFPNGRLTDQFLIGTLCLFSRWVNAIMQWDKYGPKQQQMVDQIGGQRNSQVQT